jgi:hypothetical protein
MSCKWACAARPLYVLWIKWYFYQWISMSILHITLFTIDRCAWCIPWCLTPELKYPATWCMICGSQAMWAGRRRLHRTYSEWWRALGALLRTRKQGTEVGLQSSNSPPSKIFCIQESVVKVFHYIGIIMDWFWRVRWTDDIAQHTALYLRNVCCLLAK